MNKFFKNFGFWILLIVILFTTYYFMSIPTADKSISFSQLVNEINNGNIKSIEYVDNNMTVEMKNRSLLSIEYYVTVDKFEKKVGEEWVEIKIDPLTNNFPAIYRVYPEGCVLPFETYNCTLSFSSLCNQETLSAGDYRFVLQYQPWNNYTDFSTDICEFTVTQA